MTPLSRAIGQRLRQLRDSAGLTQATLAAELGIGKKHISAVELGKNLQMFALVARYASALGVRVQTVLEPLDFEALMAAELEPKEDTHG
jgi:transcriptional regulator with XRE-family HTH domain